MVRVLAGLVVLERHHDNSYERAAFGPAWSDQTDALGAHNGCDTRNDILARDLTDIRVAPAASCRKAVQAGHFRSPYTGRLVRFSRATAASVQIDHIVPLSYAWDMGANVWPAAIRLRFANDPANLVAVDGRSNQDKSDSAPARWMPAHRGFHCQYAAQFVMVLAAYRLAVDGASVAVLRSALADCG